MKQNKQKQQKAKTTRTVMVNLVKWTGFRIPWETHLWHVCKSSPEKFNRGGRNSRDVEVPIYPTGWDLKLNKKEKGKNLSLSIHLFLHLN